MKKSLKSVKMWNWRCNLERSHCQGHKASQKTAVKGTVTAHMVSAIGAVSSCFI